MPLLGIGFYNRTQNGVTILALEVVKDEGYHYTALRHTLLHHKDGEKCLAGCGAATGKDKIMEMAKASSATALACTPASVPVVWLLTRDRLLKLARSSRPKEVFSPSFHSPCSPLSTTGCPLHMTHSHFRGCQSMTCSLSRLTEHTPYLCGCLAVF